MNREKKNNRDKNEQSNPSDLNAKRDNNPDRAKQGFDNDGPDLGKQRFSAEEEEEDTESEHSSEEQRPEADKNDRHDRT